MAVLLVLLYHTGAVLPGGFIGVDVFFVISGYVITASLQREWLSTGTIRFRNFYTRRVRRLLPALALLIAMTVFASILFQSKWPSASDREDSNWCHSYRGQLRDIPFDRRLFLCGRRK